MERPTQRVVRGGSGGGSGSGRRQASLPIRTKTCKRGTPHVKAGLTVWGVPRTNRVCMSQKPKGDITIEWVSRNGWDGVRCGSHGGGEG